MLTIKKSDFGENTSRRDALENLMGARYCA